jgi:type I restriction enzyme S subunit
MTLATFFKKFDQFADAPNAVAKMRELVLDLAVTGRLVAPKTKWPEKPLKALATKIGSGATPSGGRESYFSEGIPLIRSMNVHFRGFNRTGIVFLSDEQADQLSNVIVQTGDVLLNITGASIGRVTTAPSEMAGARVNQHVTIIRPTSELSGKFLSMFLASPSVQRMIDEIQVGATRQALTKSMIEQFPIPLPPLAEQKRIVTKVDELMALCDRLEAQQQERATRHADLARATMTRFAAAPTPTNLQFIFHKSYDIPPADLRKSILTLAVQGKLVPQDPKDEPAEELRDAPVKAAGKKAKWAGQVDEPEQPFQLPPSWKWFRLGNVSSLKHGYAFSSNFFTSEPAPFVLTTPGNFYEKGGFRDRESKRKYYSGPVAPEFVFKPGDLIIPMTEQAAGLLGSPAFIPDDGRVYIHNQRLGKLTFLDSIAPEFAFWFFNCDFFRAELARTCTGMKVRHTSPDRVLKVPFPLPPLAEQRRIVAKVDQLMALVDQLETHLAASRATAKNLLEALVAVISQQT